MIRSLPLVRRTLFLSVCGLFLFSGRLFAGNPLLMPSEAPYGAPRFDRIHAADIMPAIEEGIRAYKAGIAKIRALDPAEATFENVVVPLDRADSLLDVPRAVLGYLKSNFGGDSVIRISLESAQLTGEAYDAVTLDTAIFRLVKAVYDRRDAAGLDSLQLRTLGKVYRSYIRGGALCTPGQKVRLKELNREISLKRIRHGQNITQATQEFVLYVQDSSLLDGLAGTTRQRFARNAARQGHQGVWAVGFTNGDYASVMASATNRDLRRRLYEAYTSRCMDRKYDNRQLSVDIVNLRLERARMLGYENYAAYTLETNMAGTPEKVRELLLPLKDAAAGKGRAERAELEAFAVKYERDSAFRLEPWDVAFYSGKLRKAKFGSELGRMRNYLFFDNVLNDGVFYVANRLFGITLTQRTDIPVFHPDVLTFEAKDAEGRPLGLLYLDCFVRKGKRGGSTGLRGRPGSVSPAMRPGRGIRASGPSGSRTATMRRSWLRPRTAICAGDSTRPTPRAAWTGSTTTASCRSTSSTCVSNGPGCWDTRTMPPTRWRRTWPGRPKRSANCCCRSRTLPRGRDVRSVPNWRLSP